MTDANAQTETAVSHTAAIRTAVGAIARDLAGGFSRGDVAELRRLQPDDASCAAFWKVCATRLATLLPGDERSRVVAERKWAVILRAMAELEGLHASGARLGVALATAGVTEARVLRLLRARAELLEDAVRHVAHQLASRATPSDQSEFALLVLSERSESWAEIVRRQIARDFYGANTKSND